VNGLQFSPQAALDLADIEAYHAQRSPANAARIIDAIEQACNLLGRFPGLGRARDDLQPGLRSYPSGQYVIFFRVQPGGSVEIVRILHGSRDFPAIFGNP
jgi:toxin ParE1/3/4